MSRQVSPEQMRKLADQLKAGLPEGMRFAILVFHEEEPDIRVQAEGPRALLRNTLRSVVEQIDALPMIRRGTNPDEPQHLPKLIHK